VTDKRYEGAGEGPEYETAWAYGPDCGIDNMDAVTKANFICNEQGLDCITMGATIACAMDMFEDGVLTLKDTGGMPVRFGDADAIIKLTEMTAAREGFGDKLAEGSYRLAASHGHPEYLDDGQRNRKCRPYDPRPVPGHRPQFTPRTTAAATHVRGYTIFRRGPWAARSRSTSTRPRANPNG
jgi:Aldehyde:ferredoxin oxidoreductase